MHYRHGEQAKGIAEAIFAVEISKSHLIQSAQKKKRMHLRNIYKEKFGKPAYVYKDP